MKYRGIFEYEYPTEHKPPVSIDVQLHGDCVKGKIIEWEYRPLEQEPFINKPCVSEKVCEHDKNVVLDKIRAKIIEEKDFAYADFEQYKVDCLGVDAEYVEDELPQDDFRYGMERALEIIDKYKAESEV